MPESKRPISITIIGILFIAVGVIGVVTTASQLVSLYSGPEPHTIVRPFEFWPIQVSRVWVLVSGVFLLLGFNWARWLLVVWMAFHIVIGALHSPFQLLMHVVIFSVVLFFLFRPPANTYLSRTATD